MNLMHTNSYFLEKNIKEIKESLTSNQQTFIKLKMNKPLLLLLYLISFIGYSQRTFQKYLIKSDTCKIGEVYLNKNEDYTEETKYLGDIYDEKNIKYSVFLDIFNITGKGVSRLILYSKSKSYSYRLDMPSDAPFKISNNRFYFYKDGIMKTKKLNLTHPELICFDGCFDLEEFYCE